MHFIVTHDVCMLTGGEVGTDHFFDTRKLDLMALAAIAVGQQARYRRERALGQSGQDLESDYDEPSDDEPPRTVGPAEQVCSQRSPMTRTPARVKMESIMAEGDIRERSIPNAPGKPLAQVKMEQSTSTPMSVKDGKRPFTTATHIDMSENSDDEGVERVWSYQQWGIVTRPNTSGRPRESDTSILKSLGNDGEAGQMETAAKISKAACSTKSFTEAADRALAIENAKMSKVKDVFFPRRCIYTRIWFFDVHLFV